MQNYEYLAETIRQYNLHRQYSINYLLYTIDSNFNRAIHDEIESMNIKDAVEVVRCRDCIYRSGIPGQPNIDCYQMHDDDFCSYGKKKE